MKYTATCETILQYMDGISSKFSALIIKIAVNVVVCRLIPEVIIFHQKESRIEF